MLTCEQILDSYPKELGRPDAILLLWAGLENARVKRRSAALQVQHFLDEHRPSSPVFAFFQYESTKLLTQLGQKYLSLLDGQEDVHFSQEELAFLLSKEGEPLNALISKHGLISFDADKSGSYTQPWR